MRVHVVETGENHRGDVRALIEDAERTPAASAVPASLAGSGLKPRWLACCETQIRRAHIDPGDDGRSRPLATAPARAPVRVGQRAADLEANVAAEAPAGGDLAAHARSTARSASIAFTFALARW